MLVHTPQPTRGSGSGCCRWPWVNIDMVRIVFLGLVLVLYMFFGAAVFSALERPSELEAHKIWTEKQEDFAQEHSVWRTYMCCWWTMRMPIILGFGCKLKELFGTFLEPCALWLLLYSPLVSYGIYEYFFPFILFITCLLSFLFVH